MNRSDVISHQAHNKCVILLIVVVSIATALFHSVTVVPPGECWICVFCDVEITVTIVFLIAVKCYLTFRYDVSPLPQFIKGAVIC